MNRALETYIRLGNWGLKLFFLNILWVLFSLVGLVFLGLFPATLAVFSVQRKLVLTSEDTPVFRTFWQAYKTEFVRANLLGYLLLAIGLFIHFDISIVQQLNHSTLNQLISIGLYALYIALLIISLNVFPIFSHYNLKLVDYIKYSIVLTIAKPLQTVFLIIGTLILAWIYFRLPGLIPVFGISLFSLMVMKISSRSFAQPNEH